MRIWVLFLVIALTGCDALWGSDALLVIRGTVRSDTDVPTGGLTVEAYLSHPVDPAVAASHTCARVGCGTWWERIGTTTTRADGTYEVAVLIEELDCDSQQARVQTVYAWWRPGYLPACGAHRVDLTIP